MSKDLEWLKSKCVGTALHKFIIYRQTDKGVHEVCERCGEECFFIKRAGVVDNLDYLDYHLRSALPRYHPLYNYEYGK